ncbi:MAG: hypothetical protein ACRD47_05285 [Nitrososphaeraceae archaeon]
MTNKRKQLKIYHTSPATIDRDQAQALRVARKILQGSLASSTPQSNSRRKKKK